MPHIKLTKEFTRGDKVFPEGTIYFCSWSGYRELLEQDYCSKLKEDKPVKKTKTKKPIVESEIKIESDGDNINTND